MKYRFSKFTFFMFLSCLYLSNWTVRTQTNETKETEPGTDSKKEELSSSDANSTLEDDILDSSTLNNSLSNVNVNETTVNFTVEFLKPSKSDYICHKCSCPAAKHANPYIIDCEGLYLSAVPLWDESLSETDNVHLDLTHNRLTDVLPFLPNAFIDAVIFNMNEIDEITANAFAELPHLKSLSFYANKIEHIHKSAFCSHNDSETPLEVLNLSNNSIHSLDKDLFQCTPNLLRLNLANNFISNIDDSSQKALNSLRQLKHLDLSGNGIAVIPQELNTPIRWINTFSLAQNKLAKVPDVLQLAEKLTALDISGNPIPELDPLSFVGLNKLEKLFINYMPILSIIKAGAFQPLKSLNNLQCSRNPQLQTVEPKIFGDDTNHGPIFLETLELSYNNLDGLSKGILNGTHIHNLNIQGNPIYCSCDIYWVVSERYLYTSVDVLNQTICVGPPSLQGKSLIQVNFEDPSLNCKNVVIESVSYSYIFFILLAVTVSIILLAMIFCMIRSRRKAYNALKKPATETSFDQDKYNDAFDPTIAEEFVEFKSK